MVNDPWVIFDEALMETGQRRVELLDSVLRTLETTDIGTPVDKVELAALVRCELAYAGAVPLDDAVALVDHAETLGRVGWPNYYLAEAAIQRGEHRLALVRLRRIPDGFFEAYDLFWRTLRCWELEAIAHISFGDWSRVNATVEEVATAYAVRGDSENLVESPRDLVIALLSVMPEGGPALALLAASLDINVWFDPILASRIRAALDGPGPIGD